jgi:hypothetical protein
LDARVVDAMVTVPWSGFDLINAFNVCCDTKSHVASGSVDWSRLSVGDVASGQCPRPVSTVTCVAGNGRVRSSRESPRVPAPSGGHR